MSTARREEEGAQRLYERSGIHRLVLAQEDFSGLGERLGGLRNLLR